MTVLLMFPRFWLSFCDGLAVSFFVQWADCTQTKIKLLTNPFTQACTHAPFPLTTTLSQAIARPQLVQIYVRNTQNICYGPQPIATTTDHQAPSVWSTNTKTIISDHPLIAKLGNLSCLFNEADFLGTERQAMSVNTFSHYNIPPLNVCVSTRKYIYPHCILPIWHSIYSSSLNNNYKQINIGIILFRKTNKYL